MNALVKASAKMETPDQQQYLTFTLGSEIFAIGILSVKEIIEYGGLTEVPMMPDCVRGVINLRGSVVPVVDLAGRFGRKTGEVGRRTCIVIVETESHGVRQDVGVVVDGVNEVLDIRQDCMEPPPAFGARVRADFIQGMGKVEGRFVIVLNIHNVLSMDDVASLAVVGESQGDAAAVG